MKYAKQKGIKEETDTLFPKTWKHDTHRQKQRFLYNHLRLKGLPQREALSQMQKQNLYHL